MWHYQAAESANNYRGKNRIMCACQDGVDGSHFRRDKTLSKVRNKKGCYVHEDMIKVMNVL